MNGRRKKRLKNTGQIFFSLSTHRSTSEFMISVGCNPQDKTQRALWLLLFDVCFWE